MSALQLALQLESYAVECANRVSDHDDHTSSEGYAGRPLGSIPDAPTVALDHRNHVAIEFAVQVAQLEAMRTEAMRKAHFWPEVAGDEDGYYYEVRAGSIELAIRSLDIASALRTKHKLEAPITRFGVYDSPRQYLDERMRVIAAHKAKNERIVDPL